MVRVDCQTDAVRGKSGTKLSRLLLVGCVTTIVVAATLAGVGAGVGASSPARAKARLVTIDMPAPGGEIGAKWLNYAAPPRANVLLPPGYNPEKRYPLVVFLNGLDNDYASYAQYGLTKPFDHLGAIVVMPEGGNGWFTDWWNDGARGVPSWESYQLETVIPTILARYPILPQRRYHALIGISMGGLGATYLGGRLPGFFGSVASLSGFVDPQYLARQQCSRRWRSSRTPHRMATATPIRSTVPPKVSTRAGTTRHSS